MSASTTAPMLLRIFAVAWNILAAANMVLVALLLIWRGEALGPRVASGLSLGLVTLALANFLYSRTVLLDGMPVPRVVLALWTLTGDVPRLGDRAATAAATRRIARVSDVRERVREGAHLLDRRRDPDRVVERRVRRVRRHAEHPARHRASCVRRAARAARGVRALHAAPHDVVLEHVALAERELSGILEQRVALRTEELAEAHRVLQRMWALGQQIALELNPAKVLQRFIEASVDVLRADGAAIGIVTDERIAITTTHGHGEALSGASFAVQESTLGRVARNGHPWTTSDARAERAGDDVMVCGEARGLVVIPLHRRAERIGAMMLFVREPRVITEREIGARRGDGGSAVRRARERGAGGDAAQDRVALPHALPRGAGRGAHGAAERTHSRGERRGAGSRRAAAGAAGRPHARGSRARRRIVRISRDQVARVMDGEEARFEVRVWHGRRRVRIASLAARLLPEADPPQMLVVGRDMTADREMRARLAESERLASAGELLAGVAHEVNNPLSTISAFAQILEREAAHRFAARVDRGDPERDDARERRWCAICSPSRGAARARSGRICMNELVERTMRLRMHDLKSRGVDVRDACSRRICRTSPPTRARSSRCSSTCSPTHRRR